MPTESAPRRRLVSADRRRQLVELGLDLLSREPRELVAIDRIAEVAGISRGLLFHYFPTKRDYHLAVVEAACARLLERTEPDLRLEPEARLRHSLEAYLDFMSDNESLYRALIRGAAGADDELQATFERTREAIVGRVLAYLGPRPATALLRTALHGWVGFIEESTLDWLRHRDLSRDVLVELQSRHLEAALSAAAGTEPA